MRAIVLTCSKYVRLTDHMIRTYERRWPENPFTFRIPFQRYPGYLKKRYGQKIELIRAPEDIKNTVLTLLTDLQADEWVYWCIDDKYLIKVNGEAANKTYKWVAGMTDPSVASVSFCRCRGSAQAENIFPDGDVLSPFGQKFLQKKAPFEFWIHHFVRVKILQNIFLGFPDEPFAAKQMDYFLMGLIYSMQNAKAEHKEKLRQTERWLVLEKNAAVFGESTSRGELTANCAASFCEFDMKPPQKFPVSESEVLMGELE